MDSYAALPPVFIVGAERSGSTLLRLMLDSHPQISNPGECDFLFDKVGDQGEFPEMQSYLDWLSSDRIFQAKHLQVDTALPYIQLIQSFIAQFRSGESLLTMNVHRDFHRIPYVIPDARYVHLLRDPRDVARSCIGMGWVGHVYYGVDIWADAENSWLQLKNKISEDHYFEIKYEDLVNDVESGLSAICNFLGVEYSNEMLNYVNRSSYSLPDKRLSYQWKNKYTTRELQLVEGKVSHLICAMGYELSGHSPAKPGFAEKIMLYLRNKRFCISYRIKRYGFRLYLENLFASRIGTEEWRRSCERKRNRVDVLHLK